MFFSSQLIFFHRRQFLHQHSTLSEYRLSYIPTSALNRAGLNVREVVNRPGRREWFPIILHCSHPSLKSLMKLKLPVKTFGLWSILWSLTHTLIRLSGRRAFSEVTCGQARLRYSTAHGSASTDGSTLLTRVRVLIQNLRRTFLSLYAELLKLLKTLLLSDVKMKS